MNYERESMSATGVSVVYTPSVLQLCVYVFEWQTSSVSSGTGLHDPGHPEPERPVR